MKGSEKKVSFSSPSTKSSASPKGSDENDRSNHEMGLNLQNPLKKQTLKNFMSPTVSASSKATFPIKKILADRNEFHGLTNSSNTHFSKTTNFDSKPSPKSIPKASPKNHSSSQKTPLSYNSSGETPSSPRPYDPQTNYLSPRPQFLRYNPSRRKEIFLCLEMEEDKEGGDNELSVNSSSSSASFDSKKAADDDEADSDNSSSLLEDEESDVESDEEAEEEEVGWSLRGVFQYLLISVVLVLTTSYISSMNSPTSAPDFQDLTFGQNKSYGIVEVGCKFFEGKREQLGEEMLEDRNVEFVEMVEELKRDGKSEDVCEESGEAPDQLAQDVELLEKQTVENIEEVDEAEEVKGDRESEDELVKTVTKVSDQLVEDIEVQERKESGEQIEDVKENGEVQDRIEEEMVKTGEVSDQLVEEPELQKREESGEQIEDVKEVVEEELVKNGEVSDQMIGDIELLEQETAGHIEFSQGDAMSMTIPVSVLEWLNQHLGTEILVKIMFGVFTCAAIVASLVLGSNIKRKGIASKQSTKSVVKEKPSLVLSTEREEQRMQFNSMLNTAPLNIRSIDKGIEETYQIRAPSVELLGEFEVGGISSSLKTCAIQSRMKDIVSSYADVLEKDLVGVKAYSTPVQHHHHHHHQHDFSDISTANSSSSEGLTSAKKKLSRKEFGNNNMQQAGVDKLGRDDNMATPTPLRRSARIRSRSVTSP